MSRRSLATAIAVPLLVGLWVAAALLPVPYVTYHPGSTTDMLSETGGKELRPTDVCLLGDDTIHKVANPTGEHAGAIHIYGGDFFAIERSEWDDETHTEQPYDVERTLRNFERANAGLS